MLILFAPGAGAPSTSGWMKRWAKHLGTLGKVVRFDYPYMRAGRRAPDKPDVLVAAHLEALEKARRGHRGKVVLAGKSMGSRMGCHAAVSLAASGGRPPDALVCFGYPLRSPAGTLRDEVLVRLRAPILFVQGTDDPLCPLPLLEKVRARMTAPNELSVVEGGNHSLEVGARRMKEAGVTAKDVEAKVMAVVAGFLDSRLRG
ncbi:MAG TPA: alpha/beta family hydrolase [Myxococcaceae bacterium]|nr:alpha/beta family hydrolase [Myxococcaceae bacterium]